MYQDLLNFNNYGGVGAYATPAVAGASNPVGSYMQNQGQGQAMGLDFFPTAPGSSGASSLHNQGGPATKSGFGLNSGTLNMALGGLQTIGSLWAAWEANKLAKKQFKFQKEAWQTNMANQIQSYNTALADRARARAFTEGRSDEDAQRYIDENRLG